MITRITLTAITMLSPLLFPITAMAASPCVDAYRHPHSVTADTCRDHGWTVLPRLVVTPARVVAHTTLPHCREEDGSAQRSRCTWNIGSRVDGNGIGRAFWVDRHDHIHYVRRTS